MAERAIWLRFLSGTDIEGLNIGSAEAIAAVDTGRLSEQSLYAQLGEIVGGRKAGRERPDERILLWHRGLATTDVALGQAILERAIEQDVGTLLPYR